MSKKIFFGMTAILTVVALSGCELKAINDILKQSNDDVVYKDCLEKGGRIVISKNEEGNTEMVCETEANKIVEETIATSTEENTDSVDVVAEKAEPEPTKTEKTESAAVSYALTGRATSEGVKLMWDLGGLDVSQGYKIVKSTKENPVYPGNDYQYITDPNTKSYLWKINDGKTYYFRVCQYLGGECGAYTNNLKLTTGVAASVDSPLATAINLAGSSSSGKVSLNWDLVGGGSPKGYKVVMADHENPVYPGDYYHYISSENSKTDVWSGEEIKVGFTYHFRVCVYLGGECGTYSNDLSVTVVGD